MGAMYRANYQSVFKKKKKEERNNKETVPRWKKKENVKKQYLDSCACLGKKDTKAHVLNHECLVLHFSCVYIFCVL